MTDDVKQTESSDAKAMEGKGAKVSKAVEKLVDEIAKLSVLELSELVTALQEKLGVSAAAPMVASNATSTQATEAASGSAAPSDGGGAQNLVMTGSGDNKIAVIKALREINQNWGLKEAKDMTEQLPAEIIKGGKPEEVKAAADKLKAAGAQVEMK